MDELSFTQEYVLCVLNQKGSLRSLKQTETKVCLVASGIWELLIDNIIALDNKGKIGIKTDLPLEKEYLHPLFKEIKDSKPMKLKVLVEKYSLSFTDKKLNSFIETLIFYLVQNGTLLEEKSKGLFGNKSKYTPKADYVNRTIEKIRAEFLEDGDLSDETAILSVLLKESKLLKKYFSQYESEKLKERIKDLKDSSISPFVKEMIDQINAVIIATIVASSVVNH